MCACMRACGVAAWTFDDALVLWDRQVAALRHPNLVRLIAAFQEESHVDLVMNLCEGSRFSEVPEAIGVVVWHCLAAELVLLDLVCWTGFPSHPQPLQVVNCSMRS